MFIFSMLIFLAVTLGLVSLFLWVTPNQTDRRLQALKGAAEKSPWTETVVKIVGPFAQLSSPTDEANASPLRLKFLNAGIRHADAQLIYFGAKTLLPLLFASLAFTALRVTNQSEGLTLVLYLALAALIGCYVPNFALHRMIKSRQREIFENFPDATDLMLVCIEAGLGLDAALTKVTEELRIKSAALANELHWTNLEMRAGSAREQSLRNLAVRTGIEEVRTFANMLTQADKFGTSIGESLRVFSDDLRHKRQIRAEELASKIPTKMLFPLVVCVFPSIIMVIMGPAVIQVIRTIIPMLAGAG